ncbi:MAG: hydantoinase/oxoprolinase family protein, partial [Albidovulum sp.]|nr:hydantoinase/oxoprolinase family protein [Albidovulum sp.]
MGWRVGVDSGGTFTDVSLYHEESGRFEDWKIPSTPEDPSRGIAMGIAESLAMVGASADDLTYFGHGTTVATNSLIELRGAKTGLITTEGFRDLLEIGRQMRPSLYDMMADKPPVLVPRRLREEVPERIRFDGTIEIPLDMRRLREAARRLAEEGVAATAICFLYGYLEPRHEAAAKETVQDVAGGFVSASYEVAPEFREFERLSATVVNAFLGPVMKLYIERLSERLRELGMRAVPHMTQSNGGVIGFETAARLPIRTILSGPSTGVVAAQEIARRAGLKDVITFDMGGTSSDVALLENLECKRSKEPVVHGYPIKTPMLDIHTVGAGGGSIATVDSGGLLKVGPRSAGAVPGPACYGQGGNEATVTDANVVLQTLNPSQLLGGRMKLRRDLASDAVARLSRELNLGLQETAQGIVSVATANMAKALRVVSVERGYDPREHALIAFGGGGPLHAARLARELDISTIIVPPAPGSLCALGLLLTDLKADFTASRIVPLNSG